MDLLRYEELKATGRLPSPSGIALAIIKLLQRDDYQVEEVSHLVQSDPAIAGRVLKFSNQAAFGRSRPIVSLPMAVIALGASRLRDLVLGFSVLQAHQNARCGNFDLQRFWSRSLATAIANHELAPYAKVAPEENFTVGLLAGVGELSLATLFPDEYGNVSAQAAADSDPLALEKKRFGFDHRELCATLLAEWGLPKVLVCAVYHHENPDAAEFADGSRAQLLALSLHFARMLAEVCLANDRDRWSIVPELVTVAARLGMSSEELTQLADRVVEGWREWGRTLEIRTQDLPPFADLLALAPPTSTEQMGGVSGPGDPVAAFRILLIGGEADGAAGLEPMLTSAGMEVKAAGNCSDGLALALHQSPQMVVTDLDTSGQDAIAFCRAIRKSPGGRDIFIIVLAPPGEEGRLRQVVEAGADDFMIMPVSVHALELRLRSAQSMLALRDEIQRGRRGVMRTADQWASVHRRLLHTAMTDPLTKLPNRRHGEDFLSSEWGFAHDCGLPLACLMLDIDFFKRINDRYGHEAGDQVLCQLANLIKRCLRSEDLAFRYAGEEFAVICPGTNQQTAAQVGERVRHAIESEPFTHGEDCIPVTVSVGVGVLRPQHDGYQDMLREADEALYRAKNSGRNRVNI